MYIVYWINLGSRTVKLKYLVNEYGIEV